MYTNRNLFFTFALRVSHINSVRWPNFTLKIQHIRFAEQCLPALTSDKLELQIKAFIVRAFVSNWFDSEIFFCNTNFVYALMFSMSECKQPCKQPAVRAFNRIASKINPNMVPSLYLPLDNIHSSENA